MPIKQARNWNVEKRERAGCTGGSGHAWESSSRPRRPTAALLLTYTQSWAVETAVCVAEQQPPTTGGRPALTHYTLWLGSKSRTCRSARINTRMRPTNPPTHTLIHWQKKKQQQPSFSSNKHTPIRQGSLKCELFLNLKSTTFALLSKSQCTELCVLPLNSNAALNQHSKYKECIHL